MNMTLIDILGDSSFSIVDYTVVGIFLAVVLLFAFYHFAFSTSNTDQFLVGERSMTSSPVAVSTAMLHFSSLMIIDSPAEIYYYGIESFMIVIITVGVVPVSALLFIPMFHKMELTTIFQYVGHRFDSRAPRFLTSLAFILQQLFITCVVLLSTSVALNTYFQVPTLTSIIGIGIFTTISATLGGFEANVWIQVFQYICTVFLLLALVIVTGVKSGGFRNAFDLAAEHQRLKIFNFKINPFMSHNFYNFLFGYGFIILMEMATYQPFVQRYSSLPTKKDALKSFFLSMPVYIIPSLLCLFAAIFLQAVFAGCDPLTIGQIDHPNDILPYFIKKNLSSLPGFIGFFTACIVGSGICVCCTSITSIMACTYQDFMKMSCCIGKEKKEGGNVTGSGKGNMLWCRVISILYIAICTGVAYVSVVLDFSDKILPFSITSNFITINSIVYGPLAAVLLMAMFLPCVNKYGATVGLLGGISSMIYIFMQHYHIEFVAPLPPIYLGECPDAKRDYMNTTIFRFLPWHPMEADKQELTGGLDDMLTISYLLLTLIGAIITIVVGLLVSIVTGGLCSCAGRKISATMLHPLLSFSDCCIDSNERQLQHTISQRYTDRISSTHILIPSRSSSRLTRQSSSSQTQSSYYKYSSVPNSPLTAN